MIPTDEELWASLAQNEPWRMYATKGRNLIGVGWRDGVLRCAFAGKDGHRFYSYAAVAEAEFNKLRRSPFPDKLFYTNIKGKYKVVEDTL